ncbi:hypothetical protein AWB99_18120 [Mycolicibacterium confluentis]|nr:hypothetical protein AWB99_18120 [Mycolicibacterium confluentis]
MPAGLRSLGPHLDIRSLGLDVTQVSAGSLLSRARVASPRLAGVRVSVSALSVEAGKCLSDTLGQMVDRITHRR